MNKKKIESIIDRLGGLYRQGTPFWRKQIRLGDVLLKLHEYAFTCGIPGKNLYSLELRQECFHLWKPEWSAMSLQEIVKWSGWEIIADGRMEYEGFRVSKDSCKQLAKPEARALFEFIDNLDLK